MAAPSSVSVRRMRAMARIEAAIREFGVMVNHEYPTLPRQGHNKDLMHANQLTAMADILEDVLMRSKEGVNAITTK